MLVRLKRLLFADGFRYRPGINGAPTEVPDSLRGRLPKDADIVTSLADLPVEPKALNTLRDFDEVRQAAKVEDAAMEKLRKDIEAGERKKK